VVVFTGRATRMRRDCALATVDPRALSATLSELLDLGDYERLADFIRHFRLPGEGPAGDVWGDVKEAASLICEVCSNEQAEAAWHRETVDRIERREQELARHLRAMIELIGHEADWAGAVEEQLARVSVHDSATSGRLVGEPTSARSRADARSPVLAVHCLGPFHAYFSDRDVEHWPNGRGKSIFKFLVTHRRRPVGKEILMELFWPNADPYAARNNLNVAIYGLRQAFATIRRTLSVVLFRDDRYLLNPEVEIWVDYEAFKEHLATARSLERVGELALAIQEYGRAEALYQGEFLEEDRYEDWPDELRRSLQDDYLALLDRLSEHHFELDDYGACVALCSKMLAVDACHEGPHRRMMQCWSRQGLAHLSMRQYWVCQETLTRELAVEPSEATTELYRRIQRREPV
jgi:DNA-binding SARP family transcriptional activator